MAKRKKEESIKYESAVDLAARLRKIGEDSMPLVQWQYNAEMGRGNQNVYKSRLAKTAIRLTLGAKIPENNEIFRENYMPVLPHLVVIGNGITARGNANQLTPEVVAQTTDDADKDAAKAATLLLRYYDQASVLNGRLLRRQAIEWLKPCGNVFAQVWWDKDAGEDAPPKVMEMPDGTLAPGEPLTDELGQPVRNGELRTRIVPPHCILKPSGCSSMQELEWIGTQTAMHILDIKDKFGKKVSAEDNLQDLRELTAIDTVNTEGNGRLEDHARVVDLYFPPNKRHPKPEQQKYGRHIIVAGGVCLEDGVWEPEVTERYGVWHPFIKCGYIENAGDFWDKSLYDYLVDLQVEVNRLFRMMASARQNHRGALVYPEEFVNMNKLNLTGHGSGIPQIPVRPGAPFTPQFIQFAQQIGDIQAQIMFCIQQMDDIAAYYEVSRGNPDTSVKSGKQVNLLQQASMEQSSPLLSNIASFFEGIWQLQLRILSVHITEERKISIVGDSNEAIVATIGPDQLRSDDVRVSNRAAFFLAPDVRREYLQQNFQSGGYGDPRDPLARKTYADQMDMGDTEGFFENLTADIDYAKWENNQFREGNFMETDPLMLKQIQEEMMAAMSQAQAEAQQMAMQAAMQGMPPPDIQPPSPPPPYRRARPYDDHNVHIHYHNLERKSPNFEREAQANPEMAIAWDFHVKDHERQIQQKMMQNMQAMQASPPPLPPGGGGVSPPPPAGLRQPGGS